MFRSYEVSMFQCDGFICLMDADDKVITRDVYRIIHVCLH